MRLIAILCLALTLGVLALPRHGTPSERAGAPAGSRVGSDFGRSLGVSLAAQRSPGATSRGADSPLSEATAEIGADGSAYPAAPATVHADPAEPTVDGKNVAWWATRARSNGRTMRQRGQTIRRLTQTRWRPTVSYALTLASSVYGVPEAQLRSVAACESTFNPYATNGRYRGLFQLGWSPFGRFSPFDPVANALSAAATVVNDHGWRQWECKP